MKFIRAFGAVGVLMALQTMPAVASGQVPFEGSFHGMFQITFGGCANGDNRLAFSGPGLGLQIGLGSIVGVSCLRPEAANPLCSTISDTTVTVTAADGSTFGFKNQAEDCVSFTATGIVIHGSGTYQILAGTGRFAQASGSGSVHTTAQGVLTATGASGTFDPLVFSGTISS